MGKAIGIDLGTTNTAVAVVVDGRPRVLEDEKGYKVLPSVVSVKADGRFVVGQSAKSLIITEPARTAFAIKRLLGRRFDSPEATEVRKRVSFGIEPAPDGSCQVVIGGEAYTPVEIAALVLQVAKGMAERALGDTVDEAVITVPAYFNHQQRSATFEAARLAGLKCERLLNEPTAAALAYGFRKDIDRTIVIFDLGGGTFDVSVLHLSRGVYEVLGTGGDTYLGGEDFDYRLVEYLADHFQNQHGVDLRQDRLALQRVKEAAERAKCELSFTDRTTVMVPRITATQNLEVPLSRLTLESLVKDLVERAVARTRKVVNEAGLQINQIDDVVLVGGQTRMPRVREAISSLFQKEPSRSVHPEEVVAIGAAVHASSLTDAATQAPLLLDVTPFDLGIEVAGGLFQPVIQRNAHVPVVAARTFATAHDNQDAVKVTVRQGESRFSVENEFLGEFVMGGLTPAPRMMTKVEVSFKLDTNGMLQVSAREPGTGEQRQITIRNYAQVAQGGGAVSAEVEGDGPAAAGPTSPPAGGAASPEPSTVPMAPKKGGFFDRLFHRGEPKKKEAPKAPPVAEKPAPVAEVPTAPMAPAPEPEPLGFAELSELPPELADLDPIDEAPLDMVPLDEVPPPPPPPPARPVTPPPAVRSPFDDEGAGESLMPLGMAARGRGGVDPFAGAPDPFARGAGPRKPEPRKPEPKGPVIDPFAEDDAFGDDGAFGEEDDAFAMPVDEAAGHEAEEESWDRSLADMEAELEALAPPPPPPPPPPVPSPTRAKVMRELTPGEDDDHSEDTDLFRKTAKGLSKLGGESLHPRSTEPTEDASRRKKPARLKLAYRVAEAMVAEYLENLRLGGCFVKTDSPLPVGREVVIEVRAPGLIEPLRLDGVVVASSAVGAGAKGPGMDVRYRLDERARKEVERTLQGLLPAGRR